MSFSQKEGNTEEKKEDLNGDVASLIFEFKRCQFFLIKNDQRKQLASGPLQIITNEPDRSEIVFIFADYPNITHTLCILKKRPAIKMCESDYIFMNDCIDSFGLYIDIGIENEQNISILAQFEQLISTYCHFKISSKIFPIHKYAMNEQLVLGPPDKIAIAGMKLAALICKGAVGTAKGIRKATLMGTNSINKSKHYLMTKLTPNEATTSISPRVQNGLSKAQIGGTALVKVSGAVLTGAIAAANALSNEVTEAVSNTEIGRRVSSESGAKCLAAKEIVKSSVAGVYTVYDELVSSGLHLVQESSHATAQVLGHKYGDEVHRAAESAADIVDCAANTVVNVNMLGYKALAKRIAANSTVDVLSEESERKENQLNRIGINPMYAVQGLMIANNVNNELEQNKQENRKRRQEYVGIQAVGEDEHNYRMIHDKSVPNMASNVMMADNNNMEIDNNKKNNANSNNNVSIFEDDDIFDVD